MLSPSQNPKVSICVISYNQEDYVRECLESIITQKADFYYEIVVGEDCSTDNTAKIIELFAETHDNIRLLDNTSNLGVLPNFIRTLRACKGKYIAFCEGDDYWIDENKLQTQVDFLEQNTKYGGVCGEIISYNVEAKFEKRHLFKKEGDIVFDDLICQNKIHSNTILFRRELLAVDTLSAMKELSIGDWYINLLVAQQKPYYYLPYYFAFYREHNGGVFSKKSSFYKSYHKVKLIETFLKIHAKKENLLVTKESLKKHVFNALKDSSNENKKELKELFAILFKQKKFKINRSTIRAAVNLIK